MPAKVSTDNSSRAGKKVLTAALIQLRIPGLKTEYTAGNWFVTHPATGRKWAALDDTTAPNGIALESLSDEPEQPQTPQTAPDAVETPKPARQPQKRRKQHVKMAGK